VCFVTKAVHAELVSDLITDSFLAALKRLISRRGKPSQIYSDNGRTFVGVYHRLQEFFAFLSKGSVQDKINVLLQEQQITWNFILPNALHCGELWKAAVKSAKLHLLRLVGNARLTFEEM